MNIDINNTGESNYDSSQVSDHLRNILAFMDKSGYTKEHFNYQRGVLKISRGLEKISKTRFANIYWSAISLQRGLPAMQAIVSDPNLGINIKVRYICWIRIVKWRIHQGSKSFIWSKHYRFSDVSSRPSKTYSCHRSLCKGNSVPRILANNLRRCLSVLACHCCSDGTTSSGAIQSDCKTRQKRTFVQLLMHGLIRWSTTRQTIHI